MSTCTSNDSIACLSIRQPWASLCAWGIKPFENRTAGSDFLRSSTAQKTMTDGMGSIFLANTVLGLDMGTSLSGSD